MLNFRVTENIIESWGRVVPPREQDLNHPKYFAAVLAVITLVCGLPLLDQPKYKFLISDVFSFLIIAVLFFLIYRLYSHFYIKFRIDKNRETFTWLDCWGKQTLTYYLHDIRSLRLRTGRETVYSSLKHESSDILSDKTLWVLDLTTTVDSEAVIYVGDEEDTRELASAVASFIGRPLTEETSKR